MSPEPGETGGCLAYFVERRGEMLGILEKLVRIESPSGSVEGIRRFVRTYRQLLEAEGVRCEELEGEAGPLLAGRFGACGDSGPPVVLVGHSDTVWPEGEISLRPPGERDGCYYGPGVYDMRAGLVILLFALRFLRESGRPYARPLGVLLSPDEEVGSGTIRSQMENLLDPGATALVLEPPLPDGSLKLWRKGVGMYRLEVRGREAHAGNDRERGISAIEELARKILEITSWNDASRGITINVGEIRGGIATNVIPGFAAAGIDTRFDALEDGEEVDRRLRSLQPRVPGPSLSVSGGIIFPPLSPDERSRRLAEAAISAARELGLEISCGKSGGGSDGSLLAARGLAVLDGLGVEGGGAHALDEHIVIERLPLRAALLTRILRLLEGAAV